MYCKEVLDVLKETDKIKTYTQNGFKVTVRQERLEGKDRKIADIQMRKQFLEYT